MSNARAVRLQLVVLSIVVSSCATPHSANRTGHALAELPAVSSLRAGWNAVKTGGGTACADGSDYSFFVRPADTSRVLVLFQGGGMCVNAADCARRQMYVSAISSDLDASTSGGVLSFDNAENPFADYTMVVVPYCTGDLHLGDRDNTYRMPSPDSTTREVLIRHRGQANAQAVLTWIRANFRTPSRIFVIGTSAGAFAAPFYGSRFAELFPRAGIVALGDAAGLHQLKGSSIEFGNWGLPKALRRFRGWRSFPTQWGVPDMYITAARAAPRVRLVQIDHAWDQNQGAWIARLGKSAADLPGSLRSNRAEIAKQVDTFRSFTLGGLFHTVTTSSAFYSHHTDGRRVRDWVATIESGDMPTSVDCTTCWRPGLTFTSADLRYIDAAIGLLSSPSAWNPQDTTRCASDGPYSLRCALQRAARTDPPTEAGDQAVLYAAMERLGGRVPPSDRSRSYNPIRLFNDRPGAAFAEITALLHDVRALIRADLDARR
jgi:hypothetical protein